VRHTCTSPSPSRHPAWGDCHVFVFSFNACVACMTGNGFAPTILTQSPLGNKAGALAFAPAGLRDALQDLRWICMAFLSKPSQ
jgi:hypothetical protein